MIAVLLVGGEGTRLRPLTEWLPKPMLPIANRPFLEHQIGQLRGHGIDRVVLSCGYLAESIREHFGDELEYAVEPEPLGTGGAIRFSAENIDETFVVCNGDVLTDLDLGGLIAAHRDRGARATIALHRVADPSAYGLVRTGEDGDVTAFVEKPPPGAADVDTINAGTYVLEPEVLELIPPGRAVSVEREVFPELVGAGLFAFTGEGRWRDIGTPDSYLAANMEWMPAGGLVDPTAVIEAGADVTESVIGAGARIASGASIQRSVVLPGASVAGRRGVPRPGRGQGREGRVVDDGGMRAAIEGMGQQLLEGDRIGGEAGGDLAMPTAVVIAGMGGSAMSGELLRALVIGDCAVPITRVRGFGVPSWAGPSTLVVCSSYSGDTAETLACADQAHGQGASLLCVGMGGALEQRARAWGVPFAQVPGGLHPRAALGYLFGAMAGAFAACGLSRAGIAGECAQGVAAVDRDAAAALGARLATTIPLIYGSGPMAAVAYRWKTQLNENAKMHAFSHAFPELDHNEIVAWEGAPSGTFAAVLLRDRGERDETRRMIEATAELIGQDAVLVEQVEGRGDTAAARAFSMVAHGDWVSYHAALERGVNPTPVDRIGTLKQRIGE